MVFDMLMLHMGNKDIRGCIACGACAEHGECAFSDILNESADVVGQCNGLAAGSPVYYASANTTLIAFSDRLFIVRILLKR